MNGLESFIPIILIFVIMYFLLIRPQQKKIKEHKNMVDNLRRGDQVLTQGGIIGKITKVKGWRDRGRVSEGRKSIRNKIYYRKRIGQNWTCKKINAKT